MVPKYQLVVLLYNDYYGTLVGIYKHVAIAEIQGKCFELMLS